ncbi:MAG: hypothetical protein ACK4NS_02120 [Saprospiraceae bacterium]
MKKLLSIAALFAALAFVVVSCKKDDDNKDDNQNTLVELTGDLTTRTLTADKKYLLKGQVFVRSGQTLTIEPGTVILGDRRTKGTLIIDRGGKIEANGTVEKPIVFTSSLEEGIRDRGDWGGLVILGNAACNQIDPAVEGITPAVVFGANPSNSVGPKVANDEESSGTLRYVRVEFAGIELTPNNETNSITVGGAGRGTVMEYCMVSFGGDDGFEFFGGTHNAKYLVSFCTWDDDFDIDYGWTGNVQFGLAIRYPSYADQSQSNGIETDNGPNDNDVQPYTTGVVSNLTLIGPIANGTSVSQANNAFAADFRRRTGLSVFNSVMAGFRFGIRFNQASVLGQYQNGVGVLANNLLIAPATTYSAGSGVNVADVKAYWEDAARNNASIEGAVNDAVYTAAGLNPNWFFGSRLADQYPSNPSFGVSSGTITTGASFANPKFSEPNRTAFFNKTVNYRGAFGATDWSDGWAEFDPVNKKY